MQQTHIPQDVYSRIELEWNSMRRRDDMSIHAPVRKMAGGNDDVGETEDGKRRLMT